MLAKIYSAAVYGVDAYEVEIEVNGAHGNPKIIIVGLPDTAVKESQDRVTTAIINSGYHWPRGRTTINLAPADIKKEGPSFDLPIALGMIAVAEELDGSSFEKFSFVGELALDGETITAFTEKPEEEGGFISGGYFVFDRAIANYLDGDACVLEVTPFETLSRQGKLKAWRHDGFWQCMDTFRDQELLNKLWTSGRAPWKVW